MERKNAHKPETFQTHFEDYRVAKTEKGIHNENIYNFDETGFRAGVGMDQWVITKDDTNQVCTWRILIIGNILH